ncbi:MAG: sigma-54 dependent transcriptional regulator [Thiohalobacteraceae bacterium]
MLRALLVDDDQVFAPAVAEIVRQEGFDVAVAGTLEEARAIARTFHPAVLLVDLTLPDGSGLDLVREYSEVRSTKIILITGFASVDSAIEALRMRTFDYLTKPLDLDHLRRLLMRVRLQAAHMDMIPLIDQEGNPATFGPLVGASDAMRKLYNLIEKVAPTEASVLICGESGTGKDLVGRAIHELSPLRDRPYLALNCGALAPTLVGSELFGHEKGSFTGANRRHIGYFERASGGTLFLDEVTEMPGELQVHLLRVLETGKLVRLGGDREIKVDVRVIAATNRKPEEIIAAGRFRKDLFFRLSGFPINVPPLRARDSDISLLARYFLSMLNRENNTRRFLTEGALAKLQDHSWPGNVRELRNHIERAYVMASGDEISEQSLPDLSAHWEPSSDGSPAFSVGDTLEDVERTLIYATLEYFNGNKRRAAQSLGISLKTIYNRLNQYGDAQTR